MLFSSLCSFCVPFFCNNHFSMCMSLFAKKVQYVQIKSESNPLWMDFTTSFQNSIIDNTGYQQPIPFPVGCYYISIIG